MGQFVTLHFIPLLFVVTFRQYLTAEIFFSLYFCVHVQHFVGDLFFKRKTLTKYFEQSANRWIFAAVMLLSLVSLGMFKISGLVYLFCLHWIGSELFFGINRGQPRHFVFGRTLFYVVLYIFTLRADPLWATHSFVTVLTATYWPLVVAVLAYVLLGILSRRDKSVSWRFVVCQDSLWVAFFILSFYMPLSVIEIGTYHVAMWLSYSLINLTHSKNQISRSSIFVIFGTLLLPALFSPMMRHPFVFNFDQITVFIFTWSYLHIFYTFLFTKNKPLWLSRVPGFAV